MKNTTKMKAMAEEVKKNRKEIITLALKLFIITAVVTGLLAFTNAITKDIIVKNKEIAFEGALRKVMPLAQTFADVSTEEAIVKVAMDKSGDGIGYCVIIAEQGYNGDVEIMTGVLADGSVTKVELLSNGETAGLGSKASKQPFKGQFEGKTSAKLTSDGGEIDSVSGATITSRAVTKAVNRSIEIANEMKVVGK